MTRPASLLSRWTFVEQSGVNSVLRGNYAAKIDDKGRLKIPNAFRALVEEQHGAELFVTSLTGESVRIYPMPVWLALEEQLVARALDASRARSKFLDRVNYFGQTAEIDAQGRVVIHPRLRESAGMAGEVDVLRPVRLPRRLEPRAIRREAAARAVHGRRRAGAVGVRDLTDRCPTHEPVMVGRGRRAARRRRAAACSSTARSGSAATARALLEAGASPRARPRSRSDGARAGAPTRWRRSAIASSSCTPTTASSARARRARRRRASTARSRISACRRCSSTRRAAASASAATSRSTCGWISRRARPPPTCCADVDEEELADVIFQFGEERHSRRIARAHRRGAPGESPIDTTGQLAAHRPPRGAARGYQRIDPATRTFQALRIWVNRELEGLDAFLPEASRRLLRRARGSRSSRSTRSRIASSSTRSARWPPAKRRCGS